MKDKYKDIVKHYETCFEKYGDTHLGVDWPNESDALTRYRIMIDILNYSRLNGNHEQVSLLDFGCGTARLNQYLVENQIKDIEYSGLDLSEKFIQYAKKKYPNSQFYQGDILDSTFVWPDFDYIILNGVFTEKRDLTFEAMWSFFSEMIAVVFQHAEKGIAFNVMSKNVDWERDDLFHVSLDQLTMFLCKNVSRNFVIRNDYGLYEYTVYLFK